MNFVLRSGFIGGESRYVTPEEAKMVASSAVGMLGYDIPEKSIMGYGGAIGVENYDVAGQGYLNPQGWGSSVVSNVPSRVGEAFSVVEASRSGWQLPSSLSNFGK